MTDDALGSQPTRAFAVTNRTVLAIAVPMTLAYLTTPLLGIDSLELRGAGRDNAGPRRPPIRRALKDEVGCPRGGSHEADRRTTPRSSGSP